MRPYVRASVTLLLENRSLLFSETLQLVRVCKREKNVPSAFLKKIGHFGPKCPKMEVFRIFGKIQKWTFWPNLVHFGSLDEVVGDLRIHVRAYVRSCVRASVTRFF